MKIAELTITFEKLVVKSQLREEILETKRLLKHTDLDKNQTTWMDGYINGLRMALCVIDELETGGDEVTS